MKLAPEAGLGMRKRLFVALFRAPGYAGSSLAVGAAGSWDSDS
jgi:hypothetical protein